jgi:hypothetical protein
MLWSADQPFISADEESDPSPYKLGIIGVYLIISCRTPKKVRESRKLTAPSSPILRDSGMCKHVIILKMR